jgi:uncharacterized membrane protein YjgN (DUF898 family)
MDSQQRNGIEFTGNGGEFFRIWIVNLLLTIVTLGIYSAWAKVRTNKYFYNHTYLAQESFDYHAKPMQILIGRVIAIGLFVLFSLTNSFMPTVSLILMLAFYLYLPALIRSNTRFDCAMTSYQNVRFRFVGGVGDIYRVLLGRGIVSFIVIFFSFMLVMQMPGTAAVVGFGVIALLAFCTQAWVVSGLTEYLLNGYRYGDAVFSARLELKKYLVIYAQAFVLWLIITLLTVGAVVGVMFGADTFSAFSGLSGEELIGNLLANAVGLVVLYLVLFFTSVLVMAFTTTKIRNYQFTQTSLLSESDEEGEETQKLHFESDLTVLSFSLFTTVNFILQVITLGLARPWVKVRVARYLAVRTQVLGEVDTVRVRQVATSESSSIADGIADTFDIGVSAI